MKTSEVEIAGKIAAGINRPFVLLIDGDDGKPHMLTNTKDPVALRVVFLMIAKALEEGTLKL